MENMDFIILMPILPLNVPIWAIPSNNLAIILNSQKNIKNGT